MRCYPILATLVFVSSQGFAPWQSVLEALVLLLHQELISTPLEIRTLTGSLLRRLPLPLGYRSWYFSRDSNPDWNVSKTFFSSVGIEKHK